MGLLLHACFSSCDIVLKTGIHTLGGARNLKLGEQWGKGARTKAQGAIFFVWAKYSHYSVVVCIKKM